MSKFAAVVIGFNRIPGMLRLLESLEQADYENEELTLIISLDNCGSQEPEQAARAFQWSHGKKIVRTFSERQGLRNHILSCGEFLNEYDAIAVLEDDIIVSSGFYQYMKQAVACYKDNADIAGISLYSHKMNVNIDLPFVPEPDRYDVFFMQFAQSWGQIWMREQWFAFRDWYYVHSEETIAASNVPAFVANWPKTSWLKYHIKYCIAENKYFVYPYQALSTCFSDVGEHCKETNTVYQVPLARKAMKSYRFCERIEDGVCYDAFFERQGLGKSLGIDEEELCTDIYGIKENIEKKKYWLTREIKSYRKLKSFDLCMRPHECNVIYGVDGKRIFLYDTSEEAAVLNKMKNKNYTTVSYYYNLNARWKLLQDFFVTKIKRRLEKK